LARFWPFAEGEGNYNALDVETKNFKGPPFFDDWACGAHLSRPGRMHVLDY
jgi:hypothetical protein